MRCPNDSHAIERLFPRFLDRMAQASVVKKGEWDGGAISYADSSHDRGRLVLALIAIVSLKENERVSHSVSFSFKQFSNLNNLKLQCVETKYRHNIFKAASGMHRRNILAF
jgi:hypothetical protein